jgi:hypothetical protein
VIYLELKRGRYTLETERSAGWNLLADRSAAAPAVEALLSEKALVALYD